MGDNIEDALNDIYLNKSINIEVKYISKDCYDIIFKVQLEYLAEFHLIFNYNSLMTFSYNITKLVNLMDHTIIKHLKTNI